MGTDPTHTTVPAPTREDPASTSAHRTDRFASSAGDELGRGGFGTVHAANDPLLRRRVAVKRLREGEEAAFVREARIAAQLDHPAIVPIYDLVRDPTGALCVVMRLLEGESLADWLSGAQTLEERLRAMPAFLRVCEALAYAHRRGVVHLDLKPGNVMVGPDGQTFVVDWGLARSVNPSSAGVQVSQPLAFSVGGTPAYLSPEQALNQQVDLRTDVWGLGAMLFELLTRRTVWEGGSVEEVVAHARLDSPRTVSALERASPRALAAICDKALQRDPAQRYASAIELSADVKAWLEGRAVSARRRTPLEVVIAVLRRWPVPMGTGVAAVVAIAATLGVTATTVRHERDEARQLSRTFARTVGRGIEPLPENAPLFETFTDAATRYYAHLGRDATGDDRVDLALAFSQLAKARQRLGRPEDAKGAAMAGLPLLQAAVRAQPTDLDAQKGLIATEITLANLAGLSGDRAGQLKWAEAALQTIDAAPMRDSTEEDWLVHRATAFSQWLFLVSESPGGGALEAKRLDEAAWLVERLPVTRRANARLSVVLETWLAEELRRRGDMKGALLRCEHVEVTATQMVTGQTFPEQQGIALYGFFVCGLLSHWAGELETAARRWAWADTLAPQVDPSSRAWASVGGEVARIWLARGDAERAATMLASLQATGFEAGGLMRWAQLLAGHPDRASWPAAPEDAFDALNFGFHALRAGDAVQAARWFRHARAAGVARQLGSARGQFGLVTGGLTPEVAPLVVAFTSTWDLATAQGDVGALERALELLARQLEASPGIRADGP